MHFYRITALILAFVSVFSLLSACKDSASSDGGTETDKPVAETTPGKPKPKPREQTISPVSDEAGNAFLNINEVKKTSSDNLITRFMFTTERNPELPFSVACHITDDRITALLPAGIDVTNLIPTFTDNSNGVYIGDTKLVSGETAIDFSQPVTLSAVYAGEVKKTVTVDIQTMDTGLPSLALTVEDFDNINDKETIYNCTLYVGGGDPDVCHYAMDGSLIVAGTTHGRGNTSFGFPKKGYSVKLEKRTALLGLDKLKDWTLVSNYQDKTLMRNEIGARLAEVLEMEATVSTRSVDMWLNGEYNGTYMLIEKIEVQAIGVPEYVPGTPPEKTGYILEFDGHSSEVPESQKKRWRRIGKGESWYDPIADETIIHTSGWIVIEDPSTKKITDEAVIYIYNYLLEFDEAVDSLDYKKVSSMADLESFAKWYLVEDITKSMDAGFWCSCFMYVAGDGIIHMGPVWDFDLAIGNCNYGGCDSPDGDYMSTTFYYRQLLRMPEFRELLKATWNKYKSAILGMPGYADAYAEMIEKSAAYNFGKWRILGKPVGANPQNIAKEDTFEGQLEIMKDFLRARTKFVQNFIETLE